MLARQEEVQASEARKGMVMRAKYRIPLLFAAVAFVAAPAFATVVNINASNYAVGTNLTNAFPDVTLEYASLPLDGPPKFEFSPLLVGILDKSSYPVTFSTLGSYTYQLAFWPGVDPELGDAYAIYMAFTKPVYSVTATDFSPYDDTTQIWALNSAGDPIALAYTSIAFCSPATCNGPDGGEGQIETYSSTKPITAVLIGGSDDATYVTNISFSTKVPEPPSSAIFATGFLGMVIVILRRRPRS